MPLPAVMDSATCNVIYVDRNVHEDRILRLSSAKLSESGELRANLGLLLDAFGDVHVCASGAACISRLFRLHDTSMVELKPTLVLIDTPHDERVVESPLRERDYSPFSEVSEAEENDDYPEAELYGLKLLQRIVYETHLRSLSRLVVPIPVISFPLLRSPPASDGANDDPMQSAYAGYLSEAPNGNGNSLTNRALLRKCLDSGAVDVMASPLHIKTLTTLEVHAYRAHKEAAREQQAVLEIQRGRKRSWVGVHEEQPYAYLREAMVSGLMRVICLSGAEPEDRIGSVKITVPSERRSEIAEAVGKWHFCAPDFCDDSLLVAAIIMFRHAFSMPELEHWRIPTDQLTTFLVATRAAYNTFVPYHNFRHAVDVLQATFNFLVQIGSLAPYPHVPGSPSGSTRKSPLAAILGPFEALALLIGAIGHDVGHPGVNNGFLVVLNAPLAQLYNDRSVLESFHCAAYSQILRRYWPKVFKDTKMRTLIISSILATDMGVHSNYMDKLGNLKDNLRADGSTDGWHGRMLEEKREILCSLLIKCADISNVARKYEAALQWMYILYEEFSRQAAMESDVNIPSSLISPPKKDFVSLAKAQMGFMNIFAIPLFQGVAEVLPAMQYTVDELQINKTLFELTLKGFPNMDEERRRKLTEGILSPRSLSLAIRSDDVSDFADDTKRELARNNSELRKAGPSSPNQLNHVSSLPGRYKEVNGAPSTLNSVAEFSASDPFNMHESENRAIGHNGKQRSSETTDGSNSVPPGDWQSQATSATTGKMPLSPSTQGTSIVSQESLDRPGSVPVTTVTAAPECYMATPMASFDSANSEEDSNGNTLKPEKVLKKKTSRFRMNVSTFFRRNKGASSPSSGGS
ncbi:HD-domain/PDEase-like protein [Durotheca rogersii]|uniref:HD-domain/PDEase-like protein n=1 Tax=Durotheca rogersii TaxID=419775 RepID=UPI002220AB74|nr:HD-domain/PDEase-like protein [Durotheca rogersii]KAI5859321.1 HD-domain/PDEase-like protein [Durotheca rogersii]